MSSQVVAFRVFIASPGGLDDERRTIRDEIEKFNRELLHDSGAAFTPEGWESVPGGRRRAQELINEHLERCDYMIMVLWNRWGSPPAQGSTYSSGTEEEFALAESLIERADRPMSDILVLFKGVPDSQLQDPGPQLQKVLEFKTRLEDSKEWLYKTFDDLPSLQREVSSRLLSWAKLTGSAQISAAVADVDGVERPDTSLTSADLHVKAAPPVTSEQVDGESILEVAEDLARQGLNTQAEAAYAKAIADSDLASLESYARFLRQTGRAAKSLQINRQVLEQLAPLGDSVDTAIRRARVMTNIGITERKQGDLHKSRYSLAEAIQTVSKVGAEAAGVHAYALDNAGITAVRSGDMRSAMEHYQRSLAVRNEAHDDVGKAKTLVNIARLHKRLGDLEMATGACEEAIAILRGSEDESALATAVAALGEVLEAVPDLPGAEMAYRESLEINERIGRPGNIALSLTQVARLLIDRNDLVEAERYAKRALADNEQAANYEGVVATRTLLGRILGLTGREGPALGLLDEAVSGYMEMGNPTGEGWARYHSAQVEARMGNLSAAKESLTKAGNLADSVGNVHLRKLVDVAVDELG